MAERPFVLVPLADLAPELVEEIAGRSWRERLSSGVRYAGELAWKPRPR
jgi:7,8-dihydro-6-hydroxymethylpterin-pyrophosphokinase